MSKRRPTEEQRKAFLEAILEVHREHGMEVDWSPEQGLEISPYNPDEDERFLETYYSVWFR